MLDLDFAFFNMMPKNRQGLVNRKFFLDKLAPVFFLPRVENLICLDDLDLKGCNVLLPLGQDNFSALELDNKYRMLERSQTILGEYALPEMAVDRRLKKLFQQTQMCFTAVFGDIFIQALTMVLVNAAVSSRQIKKMILVGDSSFFLPLLERIAEYQLPISLQNYNPGKNEMLIHHLLYEKGLAISNSTINPYAWNRGDLVVFFESGFHRLAVASPEAFYLGMDDNRRGLAPDLEQDLKQAGLDDTLNVLAPILECCLLSRAGLSKISSEVDLSAQRLDYDLLIKAGKQTGIWDAFLDKVI